MEKGPNEHGFLPQASQTTNTGLGSLEGQGGHRALGKVARRVAQCWKSTEGTLWPCVTQHPGQSMAHTAAVRTEQGSWTLQPPPSRWRMEHSSEGRILNGLSLAAFLSRLLGNSLLPVHFQILKAAEVSLSSLRISFSNSPPYQTT